MKMDLSALSNFNFGDLTLWGCISAALTLLVCLIVIKIVTHILKKLLLRSKLEEKLQTFLLRGVRGVLYVVTIIIVADTLGIPSTSLVALLSVAALAVSLAIQGMLSNLAGGIMLLTARPVALGDFVEISGVTGTVNEVGLMYTKLDTPDGQRIMLPNSGISTEKIINYTTLGRRRIGLMIGASYDAATQDVRKALLAAAARTDRVLAAPASAVYVNEYKDSAIEYALYAWCATGDYWETRLRLNENVRAAFDEAGIEMTYNHLNVHIMNDARSAAQNEPRA